MTQATKQTAPRALWSTTKMAWRMDKTCVLILGAAALAGGVRPYIGILLSAWVVDALAAGEPFAHRHGGALVRGRDVRPQRAHGRAGRQKERAHRAGRAPL